MDEFYVRSSWGVERLYAIVLAAAHSTADLLNVLGLLLVLGCLVAAGVAAWRAAWIAVGCLLVVAIITAYLLL